MQFSATGLPSRKLRSEPEWGIRPFIVSLLLLAIAASYVLWIMRLPLFPTQDGPVHLVYARVMQALIFHSVPDHYGKYYTIKHLVPPYSLYYYLLIFFAKFGSLVQADKLVICLYVVLFLLGFRFLARSIGPSGDAMSLLIVPFVLNWPLEMGFVNFCLSTSLTFWALGLWCSVSRIPDRKSNRLRLIAFVVLCFAVMLTHPVPLLIVLGFCFVELSIRIGLLFLEFKRTKSETKENQTKVTLLIRDAVALAAASSTMLYVARFLQAPLDSAQFFHVTQQLRPDDLEKLTFLQRVHDLAPLSLVDTFAVHQGGLSLVHRYSLLFVLLFALALAVMGLQRSVKRGTWKLGDTWLMLCIFLLVFLPFLPSTVNHSHLFAERLRIYIFIAALAAASGTAVKGYTRMVAACGLFAIASAAMALYLGAQHITPVARSLAAVEHTNLILENRTFLVLSESSSNFTRGPRLTFDPYLWSATRIIRNNDSVDFALPWLDLQIIPVGATDAAATDHFNPTLLEQPNRLYLLLNTSEQARSIIFSQINSVIFQNGEEAVKTGPADALMAKDPIPNHHWTCGPVSIYTVCNLQ